MFRIKQAQLGVFAEQARERYVQDLKDRLRERQPELAATWDEARLDKVVRDGMDHAREAAGFTNRGPIRFWIDLRLAFGAGFLDDPVHAWARPALGAPEFSTQSERADALHDRASAIIDTLNGDDEARLHAAHAAILAWAKRERELPPPRLLGDWAVQEIAALYPEKARLAGAEGLRALFNRAARLCVSAGVQDSRPAMLMTLLFFTFGAGCVSDPAFGWIRDVLADERVPEPADRFKRLEGRALTWLEVVVARNREGG
ncbi:hypothetical protein ACQ5SO_16650 [Rhodovulum sp. DZ06]|uniref:hypothetical protein n=1 Tax=Rhodovulum sp. DZ06 TaxID=3425126 RepID=UPI003D356441